MTDRPIEDDQIQTLVGRQITSSIVNSNGFSRNKQTGIKRQVKM